MSDARSVAARTIVSFDGRPLPTPGECEDMAADGVRTVSIPQLEGMLRAGARPALDAVTLLKDAIEHGLNVEWTLRDADAEQAKVDLRQLHHLPPPRGPSSIAEEWRRSHSYGALYWRAGPGFRLLRDRRGRLAQYTINEPTEVDLFDRLHRPLDLRDVINAEQLHFVDALVAERVAVVTDGWALGLPYRMRHWPIPYLAI